MNIAEYVHENGDQIVVYQAIDGRLPFAPFVAYPVVPTIGPKGERSVCVTVRCEGQTADEARTMAAKWLADERAKYAKEIQARIEARDRAKKRAIAKAEQQS